MLSEALPVVPAKLVRRILKGEYVDMVELLSDDLGGGLWQIVERAS